MLWVLTKKKKKGEKREKMQKQRKIVKQDKLIILYPKTKSKIFSSSSGAIENILSHILELFYRHQDPHQVEEANCNDHEHVVPRLAGA